MEKTPKGMKRYKRQYVKEIILSYIPVSSPKKCFSELFYSEEECDAWCLMNDDKIFKIVEIRIRRTATEYFQAKEETE